jgi:hypothetical protein
MKSAVLARPNLKALLLGAILIAVVENFISNGLSQATILHARTPAKMDASAGSELEQLLAEAANVPTPQIYARISRCYEKSGDMKKALHYIRRAEILAQIQGDAED